jgi:hypothetical protein
MHGVLHRIARVVVETIQTREFFQVCEHSVDEPVAMLVPERIRAQRAAESHFLAVQARSLRPMRSAAAARYLRRRSLRVAEPSDAR